jgi:hypothetical protein
MDLRKRPWKRNKAHDLNLSTWNVRSLFRPGALNNLIQELKRYKINTAAVQEMRWKGNDIFDSDDYTICCSGSSDKNIFGTGSLVHKKLKNSIMDFVPVDERTCHLRLRGEFFNKTLICIHAPTEEKEETEKNSYYDKLNCVYQKAPTHDIKMIMMDMNAKVGKDMRVHNVDRYSLHEMLNDNGTRLIDFAISRNMVIRSVRFLIRTFMKKSGYPLMVIQKIRLTMC